MFIMENGSIYNLLPLYEANVPKRLLKKVPIQISFPAESQYIPSSIFWYLIAPWGLLLVQQRREVTSSIRKVLQRYLPRYQFAAIQYLYLYPCVWHREYKQGHTRKSGWTTHSNHLKNLHCTVVIKVICYTTHLTVDVCLCNITWTCLYQ